MVLRNERFGWLRAHARGSAAALSTVLLLGALLGNAPAADSSGQADPGAEMSVLAGYAAPDRSMYTSGRGFTGSVIFGIPLPDRFAVEINLNGSTFETGIPGATDFYQFGATLDLAWSLNPRQTWYANPYVLLGGGGVYDNFSNYIVPNWKDRGAMVYEGGIGVVTCPIFKNGLRLRAEGRYVHDAVLGGHRELRGLLGFFVPIGWERPEPVPIVVEHEVIKEVVREVPAAAPPAPPALIVAAPAPFIDSDRDGVEDARDRCPHTPHGAKVDENGCVTGGQNIALPGVEFDTNTARLTNEARDRLDDVVPAFIGQPTLHGEIAGHTDTVGSAAHNIELSQQRADAVRNYLIEHGVPRSQLTARGYGASQLLVSPERNEADRQRNRRVELRAAGQ